MKAKIQRKILVTGVLLLLFTPFFSFSHTYYFGFAEVEFNQIQERLEGTIVFTAHDLEEYLLAKKVIDSKFYKLEHDSLTLNKIGEKIFENFTFYNSKGKIKLHSIEFSTTRNGLFELYFTSEKIKDDAILELDFSCLMDKFPKQQNKLTFINRGQKSTFEFLVPNERKTIINE